MDTPVDRPCSCSASMTALVTHHSWQTGWRVATCSSLCATSARIARFWSGRSLLMQFGGVAVEEREIVRLLDVGFERRARLPQREVQLPANMLETLNCDFSHAPCPSRPSAATDGSDWSHGG